MHYPVLYHSEEFTSKGKRQPQSAQRGLAIEGNNKMVLFYMIIYHRVFCSVDISIRTGDPNPLIVQKEKKELLEHDLSHPKADVRTNSN